jgi:putative N6-adenine-specific DNA methylase
VAAPPDPFPHRDTAAPGGRREWFAVVAPGGEAAVARELAALAGVARVSPEPGGVAFLGDLDAGLRANLWLRGATRVLLRVGSFRARDFERLRRGAARLDWKAALPADARVAVQVAQRGSRLYHTGAVAERVGLALRDACGPGLELVRAADATQTVHVRGERDRWTLSLDGSGPRLDRRGWRLERGAAAVRETLAALVLALCEWDGELAFADGLCGAGTFAIEAAQVALRIAPGAGRSFACERWPCVDPARVAELRREAGSRRRAAPPAPIVAADRSARALAVARRNALRAGVADAIRFEATEFAGLAPPAPRGLLVLDPPYGRRLGDRGEARAGYARLARALSPGWSDWRVGLLAPAPSLAAGFPGARVAHHVLPHGGLRVHLYVLDLC